MSLVGPRPLPEYHLAGHSQMFQQLRTRVLPGITGLWQINGRTDEIRRLEEYDTYYIRNWSPWLDLFILFHTVRVVVRFEGAY
jgi:lipopolysaccharide/colanic/teichoic acid biosynthesis glycosyltransferase